MSRLLWSISTRRIALSALFAVVAATPETC